VVVEDQELGLVQDRVKTTTDALANITPLNKLPPKNIILEDRLKLITDRFLSLLVHIEDTNTLKTLKAQLKPSSLPTETSKELYKKLISGEPVIQNETRDLNNKDLSSEASAKGEDQEDYIAELNLIHAQLLEFSSEDTPQIELLEEQYKQLQQIQKDVKAGELKLKLSEADLAKESELLQQIHILQSASLETLLPAEESK
jgi:hypothetical protein